ncbi:hypothetical protein RirG_210710 [Rhizophagus irregularis DAOM 197198w]|uniref:Uncharacterized protein n=1 Tax=Rhizophagus irregularis (strain DAOM 197198w) TaxID=1432141 RepID=A0A015JPX9_RHIIW|nr:hypothetical protein RirG_210710 [Rhizophagus irregularis DAOM 197198w]
MAVLCLHSIYCLTLRLSVGRNVSRRKNCHLTLRCEFCAPKSKNLISVLGERTRLAIVLIIWFNYLSCIFCIIILLSYSHFLLDNWLLMQLLLILFAIVVKL